MLQDEGLVPTDAPGECRAPGFCVVDAEGLSPAGSSCADAALERPAPGTGSEAGVKRVVVRNAVWNCASLVVQLLAGFVVAPFLVHRLGETRYGLWILIASLTGYFSLLDLGVCGSVGRNIAFHRAKGDQDGVNGILNTALAFLFGVALVVMV